jgi:hypothetical protein
MNDCVDTLEERVLLGELGDYLSIVGQIGSNEFGSNISLGGDRGNLIHLTSQSLLQTRSGGTYDCRPPIRALPSL